MFLVSRGSSFRTYSIWSVCVDPSLQEKKIQLSEKVDQLKDKGKEWIDKVKGTKEKGNEVMNKWEERSKEFIGNFLELFGRDGRIVSDNNLGQFCSKCF